MKTIGYSNRTRYWQQYVFSHPPQGYAYTRGVDVPMHLTPTKKQHLLNTKLFFPVKKIQLFYTYNSIVANRKSWVVEVESGIPRYGSLNMDSKIYRWGVNKLKSKFCKKIIFTSEYTRGMNAEKLEKLGVNPEKFDVVYRAVERYENLTKNETTFNILFAGNGFYRKGGPDLLDAFSQIPNKDIRLTIISSFEIDWAVISTQTEIEKYKKIMDGDNRITVYSGLPHRELITHMQKAHVFVAPTHADPFNNTILEAMACGVPIISSDIRSIPEFVKHEQNGFLIPFENYNREKTVSDIKQYILKLFNDVELQKQYAQKSVAICENMFDISIRNVALKKIYDNSLNINS